MVELVTARDALKSLFEQLERETEIKLVHVAVRAGWSPTDAMQAISRMRDEERHVQSRRHRGS